MALESQLNPKYFRVARRIIIFAMICWLGNIAWRNHTTPHYETPSGGVVKPGESLKSKEGVKTVDNSSSSDFKPSH